MAYVDNLWMKRVVAKIQKETGVELSFCSPNTLNRLEDSGTSVYNRVCNLRRGSYQLTKQDVREIREVCWRGTSIGVWGRMNEDLEAFEWINKVLRSLIPGSHLFVGVHEQDLMRNNLENYLRDSLNHPYMIVRAPDNKEDPLVFPESTKRALDDIKRRAGIYDSKDDRMLEVNDDVYDEMELTEKDERFMAKGKCHDNAARLFALGDIIELHSGFVFSSNSGTWICHSWGVDRHGSLVETRPLTFFSIYVTMTRQVYKF